MCVHILDVRNLDSAPSVPRRWPSMKKRSVGRIENEKEHEEKKERKKKRRKIRRWTSLCSRLSSREKDEEGVTEGQGGRGTDGGNEREGRG